MVTELRYSTTNTYYIQGSRGAVLFDTGWAGTFPGLCRALGEKDLRLQDVSFLIISHFHPDHMGIAQDVANAGPVILIPELQRDFVHSSDRIFRRDKTPFTPIDDTALRVIPLEESRAVLGELGISGELIHTPGHSDDSISLWLDKERTLLVGDLNPLYELELHKGTQIYDTWEKLLALGPKTVYYGHARPAQLRGGIFSRPQAPDTDIYALVKKITRLMDKGCTLETIEERTGADPTFITDVIRMYVTHPGVSVQGILDRIEIKGK